MEYELSTTVTLWEVGTTVLIKAYLHLVNLSLKRNKGNRNTKRSYYSILAQIYDNCMTKSCKESADLMC